MKKVLLGLTLLSMSACAAPRNFTPVPSAPLAPANARFQASSDRVLDLVAAQMRKFYFQNNDYNKDGVITREEVHVSKDGSSILDKWDVNKDGKATFAEFDKVRAQGASGVNRQSIRRPAQNMWNKLNRDQNGFLTREEVIAYYVSFYDNIDDRKAVNYRDRARRNAVDFFVKNDNNIDQKLSFSEYEDAYAKQMLSTLTGGPINSPI